MGPLTGSLGLQGAWGCRLATYKAKNWLQGAWGCRLATYRLKTGFKGLGAVGWQPTGQELASRGLGL